jgi:3-phenylpropionate/cinnamic acid dioxygenase small subunit
VTASAEEGRQARQDIADVLIRYASGIDRRDWVLLRSCFTDDCEADYGDIGIWHTGDDITEWMRQMHEPLGHTLHRVTNPTVDIQGNEATARCYIDALVMGPDNKSANRAAGYYDDELVRGDDGWRIARRRFTMVHFETGTNG